MIQKNHFCVAGPFDGFPILFLSLPFSDGDDHLSGGLLSRLCRLLAVNSSDPIITLRERKGKREGVDQSVFRRTGNCYLSHLLGFLNGTTPRKARASAKPACWGLRNPTRLEANNGSVSGRQLPQMSGLWVGRMNGRGEIPLFHAN